MDIDAETLVEGMLESDVDWSKVSIAYLDKLIEDFRAANVGGFSMPMRISKKDPTMGGRNAFTKRQAKFAKAGIVRR